MMQRVIRSRSADRNKIRARTEEDYVDDVDEVERRFGQFVLTFEQQFQWVNTCPYAQVSTYTIEL